MNKWEKLIEATRQRNEAFERLSDADKRTVIALDALDQAKAGLLSPAAGTYFRAFADESSALSANTARSMELRDVLAQVSPPECTVCARGGLFAAMVLRTDSFKADDTIGNWFGEVSIICADRVSFDDYMVDLFTLEQLELIESAFEGWDDWRKEDGSYFSDGTVEAWNNLGVSDTARFRLIMENIVVHKGQFNPYLLPKWNGSAYYTPGFREAKTRARALLL